MFDTLKLSVLWIAGCCGLPFLTVTAEAAAPGDSRRQVELAAQAPERTRQAMKQAFADRVAAAEIMHLVAPVWMEGPGYTNNLYILNNFSEVIDLEVEILDPTGRVEASTVVPASPSRHAVLGVESLLGSSPGVDFGGSLRIRYSGDEDMIQAWMVLSGPGGTTELVLDNVTASGTRAVTTFWDLRHLPLGRIASEYYMVNGGDRPLTVTIRTIDRRPRRILATHTLLPGQRAVWNPLRSAGASAIGAAEITHDGSPGALAVAGLLTGDRFLASLPVMPPHQLTEQAAHHAIRLPFLQEIAAGLGDATLTMMNTAAWSQESRVTLVASETGGPIAEEAIALPAGNVASIDLGRLVQRAGTQRLSAARVVVRGETPGLLVAGRARSHLTGETVELSFFSREAAHSNGSYPLPDPRHFEVKTTLVNVGDEESRIVGQISWEGGTYALDPMTVPAGGSRVIDFGSIAGNGREDRLGRAVPVDYENGSFRWTVQGGGRALMARTEATPRGGGDAFGFNCFGCCPEWSWGAMLPASTTFPYYSSGPFEGVEFIDTCTGTMGPYSLYNPSYSYSWPLSWNGTSVSASAPSAQNLSFSATGHRIEITTCNERVITIIANGPATATKVTVLDASLPQDRIRVRLEPSNRSGNLKVSLKGSSTRVLVNTNYSSGDHIIGFGNLSNYTAGQSFDRVVAEWTVNGKVTSGNLQYGFEALGSYYHTQYNTPVSNLGCLGPGVNFCYFSGGCTIVQSCSSFQTATAPSGWVQEVEENGGGLHAQSGYMTREEFCSHPGSCGSTFRNVPGPCVACAGRSAVAGSTVAINSNNSKLSCGSQVYVDGIGMVEVTDYGGGLSVTQLDHYIGNSGCNQAATIGNRVSFLLH